MAKGKSKSEKASASSKGKSAAQKTYHWIGLEEVREREAKYQHRLFDIRIARNLFKLAQEQNQALLSQNLELKKWDEYVKCVNLPQPDDPPSIRTFFSKIVYYEEDSVEKSINWLLAVDERSVLTQDIFKKDRSRKNLYFELLPDLGGEYDKDVLSGLKIVKRLDDFLDIPDLTNSVPPHILDDIILVKNLAQAEIAALFDKICYRVISCEDSVMREIDARTAEFAYQSPNNIFQIHIWTLKHIPLRFEYLEEQAWEVDLHVMNLKVRIPVYLLEDDITLRALHLFFDHSSEYAVSFNPTIFVPMESLSASIPDLYECLIEEWFMQLRLMEEIRNHLLQKRLEYEEKVKDTQSEADKAAKNKGASKEPAGGKKKGKGKEKGEKGGKGGKADKIPAKEPTNIEPGKYPDVWHDFLEKENQDFQNYMNMVYHPSTLKLQDDEINLKQSFVLGGLYHLHFVEKPRHYCIRSFNITWHENNRQLVIRKDIVASCEEASSSEEEGSDKRVTKPVFGDDMEPEEFTKKKEEHVNYDHKFRKLFRLTFTLPDYLIDWEDPVGCQYEDNAIGYVEKDDDIPLPTLTPAQIRAQEKAAEAAAAAQKNANELRERNAAAFEESKIQSNLVIQRSATVFQSTEMAQGPEEIDLSPADFGLDFEFNKAQTRNLERHGAPRIMSTYCFKKEREEIELETNKGKSRGMGVLSRKQQDNLDSDEQSSEEPMFRTLVMDKPERMFPHVTECEQFDMHYTADEFYLEKPSTFYDLLQALNSIKLQYILKPERLLNIRYFIPTAKWLFVRKNIDSSEDSESKKDNSQSRDSLTSRGRRSSRKSRQDSMWDDEVGSQIIDFSEESQDRLPEIDEKEDDLQNEAMSSFEEVDERESYVYAHWTTKYIKHSEINKQKMTFTLYAERLGIFGLAYNRYLQFPFKQWSLEPTGENEVTFTVMATYVKVVLIITPDGCRGYVTEGGDKYSANPKKYLEIPEPMNDYKELKRMFREKNCNIFGELDAPFYITKGYFSQKHLATEMHTYSCMALHCGTCKFVRSGWNRLAKRREVVVSFSGAKEIDDSVVTVLVKPEDTTFVEVKELCSDDLNVFKLEFTKTWRNITPYHDLHSAIVSMFPGAIDTRVRDPFLLTSIKNVLSEVRPLSYS